MKRVHILISGRVQAVFFRLNMRNEAIALELKGFVKNLADGKVEAVFEGEKEKIDQILEFCKKGPLFARVDNIEIKEEKYKNEFDDFEIRY